MKVKDAMHKGVDWVSPDIPVTELAKLMRDHDVGAIPIGENDHLVGMVTIETSSAKDWHRTTSMRSALRRVM